MSKVDMKTYRAKRPRKDILEDLRAEGKFFEYLHFAWALIEFRADECILKAYCLSGRNPKAKPLLGLSASKKIDLFLEIGILSQEKHKAATRFIRRRNGLFHREGIFVRLLEDSNLKEEIMDLALIAVDVMDELVDSMKMTVLVP